MGSFCSNIERCRSCNSTSLTDVLNLGSQNFASCFVRSNDNHPLVDVKVPLTLMLCGECGLCQLKETVQRDALFQDYFYLSAINPIMRDALKDIFRDLSERIGLQRGDAVLDIGCNDATLLSYFPEWCVKVGVEPATNIDWSYVEDVEIINDFFSKEKPMEASHGSLYKVITSIAMLYSVEDTNQFVSDVKSLLHPEGMWCIQLSYLPAMVESNSFYDICHEHLNYFTLHTLSKLIERHGLKVVDASTNDVNGGSLRVFAVHKEANVWESKRLQHIRDEEGKLGLDQPEIYRHWFDDICELKHKTLRYIKAQNDSGGLVVGLGASTKGNVLLQFFGIDKKTMPYISERNPAKVSLRTLGTDIELISEEKARELEPSCMLVLIWFFKDEILKREKSYLDKGGKLLFPMPYCHVVSKDGEIGL